MVTHRTRRPTLEHPSTNQPAPRPQSRVTYVLGAPGASERAEGGGKVGLSRGTAGTTGTTGQQSSSSIGKRCETGATQPSDQTFGEFGTTVEMTPPEGHSSRSLAREIGPTPLRRTCHPMASVLAHAARPAPVTTRPPAPRPFFLTHRFVNCQKQAHSKTGREKGARGGLTTIDGLGLGDLVTLASHVMLMTHVLLPDATLSVLWNGMLAGAASVTPAFENGRSSALTLLLRATQSFSSWTF